MYSSVRKKKLACPRKAPLSPWPQTTRLELNGVFRSTVRIRDSWASEDSDGERPKHRVPNYFAWLLETKCKSNQQSINIYCIQDYEELQIWSCK